MKTRFTPNVERGIDYLNKNFPGWLNKVDLDTLKLDDCTRCVLGQLIGDYKKSEFYEYNGLREIEVGFEYSNSFGFNLCGSSLCTHENYNLLTETWKYEINLLRELNKMVKESYGINKVQIDSKAEITCNLVRNK